ncbi:RIP metalloprotease RseP [candidate division WOR-1 bacterium RIFCSPLOWO2_02_FULL_46_20]|uniref:Zinc metalloprotease n=2 Tax=Saganbacteria TaxID=1703751 RepID=A0A1F4RFM3_UNCSA|nr:MAG: RIP metalloprotease RseP [candidate division WOR-1 bacterium RIFCSPHIGHO2_02_FULL_45_12]OGC06985.1 MAG: RIP metalloprotease RseP [candidate division WOR-1 bacterium RIFCSPLOWO2_02_FULL_46_20]OGC09495.1 MAG: RIP metalloprotease RseP [candidate division WOR-1 bacterium RIFCSPLOWO2_12_FULL_45_9]
MLLTILSFILVFTIITLVHEGGHFIASKRQGIQVHEFGIGFGPTLFSFSKNNTTYKINLLPILGYVKIAGIDIDDPQEKQIPEAEKYYAKSPLQKFKSIFAGPFMNLVLGFILFSLIYMVSGAPAGVSNELAVISPGSEADKIGLRTGDRLLSVDGKIFASPEEAVELIHQSADKELVLGIERNNFKISAKATPKYNKQLKIGLIGFSLKPIYKKINPFVAIYYGLRDALGLMLTILLLLSRLIVGKLSFSDLAGPVGIAQITGQYAHQGFLSLISFLAFFNINVAVLNLLPLPALDGGRLFFVALEYIRRKPISIENENKVHQVGLFVLLGLLAILTVNDFLRIFLR